MGNELTNGRGKAAWIGVVRVIGTMKKSNSVEWIVFIAEPERMVEFFKGFAGNFERVALG